MIFPTSTSGVRSRIARSLTRAGCVLIASGIVVSLGASLLLHVSVNLILPLLLGAGLVMGGVLLFFVPMVLMLGGAERHDPLHCGKCGYNLTGLTEPRCPECGEPFDVRVLKWSEQATGNRSLES